MNQPPSFLRALRRNRLLPVFKSGDIYVWKSIIDLCAACGITTLEFRDGREGRGLKLFPFLVEHAARYPQFHIGVSTIKNIPACETFLRQGAAFISSPFLHPALGKLCRHYERGWLPGCTDEADLRQAVATGAEAVSILPGPLTNGHLDVLAKDFPELAFIPSCGNELNDSTAAQWLAAGALCLRREQTIFPSGLISIRDWVGIDRLLRRDLALIRMTRSQVVPITNSIL